MLVLIRHSISQQQPEVSSHQWGLTEAGREKCLSLAERIRPYSIECVYSSDEPKAITTADLLCRHLEIDPPKIEPGFRETRRETALYYESVEAFQADIRRAMTSPDELIFGEETFSAAKSRFRETLGRILSQHVQQNIAVVTHGTVLSLFLAPIVRREVFDLWKLLGMPAFAALSTPDLDLVELCLSLES